ncbi:hypothetical protein L484_016772 [Morus notabilis]|uniref:Uncharacterized protein n=1 Tax=Morus notabilis TaxID=981085 RepID=W9S4E5_9ROSA|nr:hypothetical protein L484_016772 [Morus notabilis]
MLWVQTVAVNRHTWAVWRTKKGRCGAHDRDSRQQRLVALVTTNMTKLGDLVGVVTDQVRGHLAGTAFKPKLVYSFYESNERLERVSVKLVWLLLVSRWLNLCGCRARLKARYGYERVEGTCGSVGKLCQCEIDDAVSLAVQCERQREYIVTLNTANASLTQGMKTRFELMLEDSVTFIDSVKGNFKDLENEIMVLKCALGSPYLHDGVVLKIKVPEPISFNDSRSAKELENFLWDMK